MKRPQLPEVPKELEGVAMTSLTTYRTLQSHYLAAFKARRLEMIAATGSDQRIEYEIRQAVEAEEYERAAELKKHTNQNRRIKSSAIPLSLAAWRFCRETQIESQDQTGRERPSVPNEPD